MSRQAPVGRVLLVLFICVPYEQNVQRPRGSRRRPRHISEAPWNMCELHARPPQVNRTLCVQDPSQCEGFA